MIENAMPSETIFNSINNNNNKSKYYSFHPFYSETIYSIRDRRQSEAKIGNGGWAFFEDWRVEKWSGCPEQPLDGSRGLHITIGTKLHL